MNFYLINYFISLINCINEHVARIHMILLVGSCKLFQGLFVYTANKSHL